MLVNFDSVKVAPSPRSSSATFIWSAARTKPRTSSTDCLPNLPASCASWLSPSLDVRVSIFLNSSFSFSTSSAVIPVYFFTEAISASISAYAFTAERPASTKPVTVATAPATTVCQSFHLRLMRCNSVSPSRSSLFTRSISARTAFIR